VHALYTYVVRQNIEPKKKISFNDRNKTTTITKRTSRLFCTKFLKYFLTMRLIFPIIFLSACMVGISSCSTGRITNASSLETNKPTITFKTHNARQLNSPEEVVASTFLSNENNYIQKYVEINYDSANKRFDSLYSNLNFWNKTKFILSRKKQYRLYAAAADTDHLLDLEVNIVYDTIFTAERSAKLWDHLWEESNVLTKELVGAKEAHYHKETYHIRRIKYKLRCIDGLSGKTMWSMRCRWPGGLFGLKKQSPALLIKNKFDRKFPYKLAVN
jgi:hypothetical protein